jgi:alkanesulfonate monooxygenase SsuD/methylene tetrahydromethanopterin reductase-like flavin-dependent oxidoreductase (luciferase family)
VIDGIRRAQDHATARRGVLSREPGKDERVRLAIWSTTTPREKSMRDDLTGGRLDMGLGRGLRPPEFEAFGVDQQQSREMSLESFDIIRRVWADENFVHRGKYWKVRKEAPLSPPLVQYPHPPFLVSAQSEESLR